MKNIILIITILISLMSKVGLAQENKTFRIGINLGVSVTKEIDIRELSLEPRYYFDDNISLSLKLTYANYSRETMDLKAHYFVGNDLPKTTYDGFIQASCILDYTIVQNDVFSPFIGFGFGYFPIRNIRVSYNNKIMQSEIKYSKKYKLGFKMRAGFELSIFRIFIEYNLLSKSKLNSDHITFNQVENSSLNINLGLLIGNGKR